MAKLIIKKYFLALKNVTSASKLKTELKTKNHMNWDISMSWIRTTRIQTQIYKHKHRNKKKIIIIKKNHGHKSSTNPKKNPNPLCFSLSDLDR